MSGVEVSAIAGIATATLTVLGAAIAGMKYLWDRDPVAARNGTILRFSEAIDKLAQSSNDDRHAFLAALQRLEEQSLRRAERYEERAEQRHVQLLESFEKLADAVAPRGPR